MEISETTVKKEVISTKKDHFRETEISKITTKKDPKGLLKIEDLIIIKTKADLKEKDLLKKETISINLETEKIDHLGNLIEIEEKMVNLDPKETLITIDLMIEKISQEDLMVTIITKENMEINHLKIDQINLINMIDSIIIIIVSKEEVKRLLLL